MNSQSFWRIVAVAVVSFSTAACRIIPGRLGSTSPFDDGRSTVPKPQVDWVNVRFSYPVWIPPRVTIVEPSTKLASGGETIDRVISAPKLANVRHDTLDSNRFRLTLDRAEAVAIRQDGDERCWAASAMMVARYIGRPLRSLSTGNEATQSEVSERFCGTKNDVPATLGVIVLALCPELEARMKAQVITLGSPLRTQCTDRMLTDMCSGQPAVIGLQKIGYQHAVVVVGATYRWLADSQAFLRFKARFSKVSQVPASSQPPWSNWVGDLIDLQNCVAIEELQIIDPSDGRLGTLSGEEFERECLFIVTPRLAMEILTAKENKSVFDVLKQSISEPHGGFGKILSNRMSDDDLGAVIDSIAGQNRSPTR